MSGCAHTAHETCGCCGASGQLTPREVFNRPGLSALRWRVGEYADFHATLIERLAQVWVDVETGEPGPHGRVRVRRYFPLRDLRSRSNDDPTIALLDAWSILADVLTFYTERIANEGYLRTATELQSLIELARLVGYRRRPGVSASVQLAFVADDTWKDADPIVVPAGARVQSLPEPAQAPVTFETDAMLAVRPEWNVLYPRTARPSYVTLANAMEMSPLWFKGTATNLGAGDALLLVFDNKQFPRRVARVDSDFAKDRTRIDLDREPPRPPERDPANLDAIIAQLERKASVQLASAARLSLSPAQTFGPGSTAVDALTLAFHPAATRAFYRARANAQVATQPALRAVYAMRVEAGVYANSAPLKAEKNADGVIKELVDWDLAKTEPNVLDLDAIYDAIVKDSWVWIVRPDAHDKDLRSVIATVRDVQTVSRTDYNFPARVTRLILDKRWLGDAHEDMSLADVRATAVYAAPQALALADEPVDDAVCGAEIELDRQVDGLQPGRSLIVTGERYAGPGGARADDAHDRFDVDGVPVSELVMLSSVRQETLRVDDQDKVTSPSQLADDAQSKPLPGDRIHTFLQLAVPLSYCYVRSTVAIQGNVAHATHGETVSEVLGSGDATQALQSFRLKSAPLTYTSAPNPSGIENSLQIFVDDVRWREASNPLDLGPTDRGYWTKASADAKTTTIFGDGRNGSRLSTGNENVRAMYRSGIGDAGNVRARTLTQLVTRTEGLRGADNPQPASGGADPESSQSMRSRAPLAVAALDRLVATVDYADFARLSAGIGKASASRLRGAHGEIVQVTIAGQNDIPIDEASDLFVNLLDALERYGDPEVAVQLARRELMVLVIVARVRLDADHVWETVRPRLEAALFDAFGFEARDLGQDAYAAEAVAALQAVDGVDYVDLDLFTAISEQTPPSALATIADTLRKDGVRDRIAARRDRVDPEHGSALPAQLVTLDRRIPATVMLTEVAE